MDELARLYYQFWSQFTGAAFASGEVPDGQAYPYITYDLIEPEYLQYAMQSIIVWDKPSDGSIRGVTEICKRIGEQIKPVVGKQITLPDKTGAISLRRGNPFTQFYPQEDNVIKANYINIQIQSFIY